MTIVFVSVLSILFLALVFVVVALLLHMGGKKDDANLALCTSLILVCGGMLALALGVIVQSASTINF